MSVWRGNPESKAPNNIREPINVSEKPKDLNRASQIRRDTDDQKNITISLYDIDQTILDGFNGFEISVEDGGKNINVPIFYSSPELWKSIQKDGCVRDYNGKLQLPLMVLKRTSCDTDERLSFFNRYLHSSAMKLYSSKNKYTKFSALNGQNAPINEVYNIMIPKHVKLSYTGIIWTEKVEQMNVVVEKVKFNATDYIGTKERWKFRSVVGSMGHQVEIQIGDDRMVKTEFTLTVYAYILPETVVKLGHEQMTNNKLLTPKKIMFNISTAETIVSELEKNAEKWRNPIYPNLPKTTPIVSPSVISNDMIKIYSKFVESAGGGQEFHFPPPSSSTSTGTEGWLSYDSEYYYIYTEGKWNRLPIALFNISVSF